MTFTTDQLWYGFWIAVLIGCWIYSRNETRTDALRKEIAQDEDELASLRRQLRAVEAEIAVLKGIAGFTQATRHSAKRATPRSEAQVAAEFIATWAVGDWQPSDVFADPDGAYRAAARRCHPDAGGTDEDFKRLQKAKRILDGAR